MKVPTGFAPETVSLTTVSCSACKDEFSIAFDKSFPYDLK